MKKINKHPALIHAEDLKMICNPLQKLGICYFSHVNIDEKNQFSAIGIEPQFVKLYFEKEYYNYDVHMLTTNSEEEMILWDTVERSRESKDLYDDFQALSLGHTFSILRKNGNKKDCYHFATKLGNEHINGQYLRQQEFLKKFILHFNDKVQRDRTMKQAYSYKFKVSDANSGYFIHDDQQDLNQRDLMSQVSYERIYIDDKTWLSHREVECLHWLSLGKTCEEIGIILSITPRTVKAHIRNIKDKLKCNNQFQLGLFYNKIKSLVDAS